jgi:hypothetical protein
MRFLGARTAEVVGEEPISGVHNYFLGNDPSRWKTDVPRFEAVRYRDLYPGMDVRLYEKEGHLEYDLALSPGAALNAVEVAAEGADRLRLDEDGTLILETGAGLLHQPPPATFEVDGAGRRRELAARYEVRARDRCGFVVPDWSGATSLVLDPGILWSTFVGGARGERAADISVSASGVITIAGSTDSPDYPTTPGAWDTTHNVGQDVFVTRLDPSLSSAQQLLYSTFLGGADEDGAHELSVDATGVVTIAGVTMSTNFPTTPNAWDTTHNGFRDVFVTRLDPSLPSAQQLVYSTFVGGTAIDEAYGLSVDASGVVTITGRTASSSYPTTPGAWSTSRIGDLDDFVTRLDPSRPATQQILYSTFLGGTRWDQAGRLTIDASGVVTIAGLTGSSDFPTTPGAWDRTHNSPGGIMNVSSCVWTLRCPPPSSSATRHSWEGTTSKAPTSPRSTHRA